jgi:5'-3' exonuclease
MAIAAYMNQIVAVGKPSRGVYISCDGVVCAAKRRQQRLRRFKGPWFSAATAAVEGKAGSAASSSSPSWDQNALTPGSAFMALLGRILTSEGAALATRTGLTVIVSTTGSPGEGEHKLLAHMRHVKPSSCMIYGLDADLILLAMLLHQETGARVDLLREAQEFETKGSSSDVQWKLLHVVELVTALGLTMVSIPSFVAGMSLLGNDFLPRSLTRTVRDDGIPQLIASLTVSGSLVAADGSLSKVGLKTLVGGWAAREEDDMLSSVRAAIKAQGRYYPTDLEKWAATPAVRCGISALWDSVTDALKVGWRDIYRSWCRQDVAGYCAGFAWVWDYYKGRPVDQGWFFEPHLPPLWCDIAAFLDRISASPLGPPLASPPIVYPTPLPEWLHLFAVLPAESIERLLPEHAALMIELPWYWPTQWSLFDIGRTQMWECEAVLPIPSDAVLRALITVKS